MRSPPLREAPLPNTFPPLAFATPTAGLQCFLRCAGEHIEVVMHSFLFLLGPGTERLRVVELIVILDVKGTVTIVSHDDAPEVPGLLVSFPARLHTIAGRQGQHRTLVRHAHQDTAHLSRSRRSVDFGHARFRRRCCSYLPPPSDRGLSLFPIAGVTSNLGGWKSE